MHPDRNYGDVEQATESFAEVQSAYEVLSDPQERAWYDSHRETILRGGDTDAENHFEHNIRLTSADDIVTLISRFSKTTPFTNGPDGFYGVLSSTFASLAREEEAACEWEGLQAIDYPEFGNAGDSYEDVVKPFYGVWLGFSTKKSYSWKAEYRYSEAPDRRIRRAMEKENKRLCDEAIREFNDAVRAIVAFARKRDPRYISNAQSEAERQKILREAAAAQSARSRAANQAKLDVSFIPDWAKTEAIQEEDPFSGEELSEEEHYECVACGKTFKSEKQYEAHERSKKHIKTVHLLRRQMQKENKSLNLDLESFESSEIVTPTSEIGHESAHPHHGIVPVTVHSSQDSNAVGSASPSSVQYVPEASEQDAASGSDDLSDEYASRGEVEGRFSHLQVSKDVDINDLLEKVNLVSHKGISSAIEEDSQDSKEANQKIGKAKLRRAKRAAKQDGNAQGEAGVRRTPNTDFITILTN